MKRTLQFTLLALFIGLMPIAAIAQVQFLEDFDGIGGPTSGGAGTYSFPTGWLLRNVDNGAPATAVSYVNEAWERREDFQNNVADSAAFSTSWTAPASTANDWMWTPLISSVGTNASLYWNALAYDPAYSDGYEVRVMVSPTVPTGGPGVIGNQISNSTQIFTIAAENNTWTARTASLAAYAGQSIRIGYRNNSNDKFLLLIDDVRVESPVINNAQMLTNDTLEYTIVPQRHQGNAPFNGKIQNFGSNAISSVYMQVNVRNFAGTVVYTANSASLATLASNAVANFSVPAVTNLTSDFYTIEYIAKHSVADANPSNDTLRNSVLIDQTVYSRDDANVTGALGIGAGNGGFLGQDFAYTQPDLIDSVLLYVTRGYTGRNLSAAIWTMTATGPGTMIGTTDTIQYPDDSARVYILPIHGGAVPVAAGKYAVTAVEYDSTLALGQSNDIFTPAHTWVIWPTSPFFPAWASNEDFGVNFAKPYVLRPFMACADYRVSNIASTNAACGASNGTATITVDGGPLNNVSYLWSNGATTAAITGLAAGSYTCTVTFFGTCSVTGVAIVSNAGAPALTSLTATDADCNGGNGTAVVVATGGTGALTYLWSNGATTSTITAGAGTYTVTVTDQAGCQLVAGPAVITAPSVIVPNVTNTQESSSGANDGTATAAPVGGTAPYTYLWSNGATTATISGLGAGTYTVTITDGNGCTITGSTLLIVGLDAIVDPVYFGAYPNPNDGGFQIFINTTEPTDVSVQITDIAGRVVFQDAAYSSIAFKRDVNLRNEAVGMYIIRMTAGEKTISRKIEVKR
jgi:hypothetical protein